MNKQFKTLSNSIKNVGGFGVYFEDMEDIVLDWMSDIEEFDCPSLCRMIKEIDGDTMNISKITILEWLIVNKEEIVRDLSF